MGLIKSKTIKVPTKPCRHCAGTGEETNHLMLGSKLRGLREEAGISLRFMAEKLGISAPFLSDMELGRRCWTADWLNKFIGTVTKAGVNKRE